MAFPAARDDRRFVVGLVSGGHFLSHFYLLAFPPLFPLLVDEFSLSNTELGFIVSVMMLPIVVLQVPIGGVVDRVGAKRVFVVGVALTGAATLLAGAAPSYPVVLFCALLAGVGQSAFHPADYALLSAVVPAKDEGKGFSIHTFGGFAGFAAAPVAIGGVGVALGWRTALLAAGVLGLVYAALSGLTLDTVYLDRLEDGDGDATDGGFLADLRSLLSPALVAICLFFMLLFMAGTGIQSFTTVFLVSGYGLSETAGNSALTVYFTLSAAGILAGGFLADRYDVHLVVGLGLLVAGLVTGVMAVRVLPTTAAVAFVAFGVVGFLAGLIRPSRDRLVSIHSPDDSSGRSFGFVFSGGSLGGFVSPVLLGYVIDTADVGLSFLLVGAFFAACTVIVLAIRGGTTAGVLRTSRA